MLGDGGIIEKAQSSDPSQPPIGCMDLDEMPFTAVKFLKMGLSF